MANTAPKEIVLKCTLYNFLHDNHVLKQSVPSRGNQIDNTHHFSSQPFPTSLSLALISVLHDNIS